MRCGDVAFATGDNLPRALAKFKCAVKVDLPRAGCEHRVKLVCHESVAVQEGRLALPPCKERVGDYSHPRCGHVTTQPACWLRREYEERPPPCQEVVQHTAPCGCKSRLKCVFLTSLPHPSLSPISFTRRRAAARAA